MIAPGTYLARVVGGVVLGESTDKGTPFVEFNFQLKDHLDIIKYTGYLTDAAAKRTIDALRTCGWKGVDLLDFAGGKACGIDANEVAVVVEHKKYVNKNGEEKTAVEVAWVNRAGGQKLSENTLSSDKARALSAKLRGIAVASAPKPLDKPTNYAGNHVDVDDNEIPF